MRVHVSVGLELPEHDDPANYSTVLLFADDTAPESMAETIARAAKAIADQAFRIHTPEKEGGRG